MMGLSPEEQVKNYAQLIYEVIYNKQVVLDDRVNVEITQSGVALCDMIENKLKDKIPSLVTSIDHEATQYPHHIKPYFLKEYLEHVMPKLVRKASWRSYGTILLCVRLIRTVAEKQDVEYHQQLQTDMKIIYTDFIVTHFTEFIKSMGGFEDLTDYLYQVKNYKSPSNVSMFIIRIVSSFVWCANQLVAQ